MIRLTLHALCVRSLIIAGTSVVSAGGGHETILLTEFTGGAFVIFVL